ncbi:MAG TPA: accessory factor UbiK family protein [Methylophilaceae bacterium]|nr:accessory factor UbiK family protein [Methylophilaceae bacterium]
MLNNPFLDDLSRKIRDIVDSTPAPDLNKNLRALLQGAFTKLELVTREEFDIQAEVLQRTRQKLEKLESRLAEMEAAQQQDHKS